MSKFFKRNVFMRRCLAAFMCAALLIVFTPGAYALDPEELRARNDGGQAEAYAAGETRVTSPAVVINGIDYSGKTFLYNSTTYVGIREYSMFMGADSVDWNPDSKTATVSADELTLRAKQLNTYVEASGRYLWARDGVIIVSGTMYVPIRVIAKAFGCSVGWESGTRTAYVTSDTEFVSAEKFYNGDDLYWLSRIINAEAGNEPLYGKIAVGSVVMNRVSSSMFPQSIYGVIFDMSSGVQFTPAANGTVYNTPNEESVIAAKLCLEGASVSDSILFFMNGRLAESSWISDNRPYVMTIGNHDFFS